MRVIQVGVAVALDLTYELTKPYIPARFMQELQGMADATQMPLKNIVQVKLGYKCALYVPILLHISAILCDAV